MEKEKEEKNIFPTTQLSWYPRQWFLQCVPPLLISVKFSIHLHSLNYIIELPPASNLPHSNLQYPIKKSMCFQKQRIKVCNGLRSSQMIGNLWTGINLDNLRQPKNICDLGWLCFCIKGIALPAKGFLNLANALLYVLLFQQFICQE